MACGLVASNLNLKPGECLRVRGEVAPEAKSFVLNLGKDKDNLCLHFNPRFNAHGDSNTIVCNSKDGGAWGTEHREPAFPFQPGTLTALPEDLGSVPSTYTAVHNRLQLSVTPGPEDPRIQLLIFFFYSVLFLALLGAYHLAPK
uniref:Galectin n=1 Tax=Peromyscus maniculatus bairdii TaxID=230844 RepID=A0A8C8TTV1_PERMB